MAFANPRINSDSLFTIFFILGLTTALFYTGNNLWLFATSYILIIFNFALVLNQRFYQAVNISVNGIFLSVFLLLSWFAISIFPSQIKYLSLYNFFWVGSLLIVFFIYTFSDNKDKIWHQIWPGILALVLIWAIYGLVQYYYFHVPTNATFLNRNSLAALINLALIPAAAYFLLSEKERPWKFLSNKILSSALIILFLSIFIITSRGASLSLLLGFAILIILLRNHFEKSQIYTLIVIVFIAFSIAYLSRYFIQNSTEGFSGRMMSLTDTSAAGNSRYIIWKSLLPLFNEMPWYGLGLGSLWAFWPPFRTANDTSAGFFAHNDYMQLTLEAGYPGILLLIALFVFILIYFIKALKTSLTRYQRFELVSLFATLVTFAAHSFVTYNFYILPLLIISGLYLARFNQLAMINSHSYKNFPAIKIHFKPFMFYISLVGACLILMGYFLTTTFAHYYNLEAKNLIQQNNLQKSNATFLKAQQLAPLLDSPFFSHADILRRGAKKLLEVKKSEQAKLLLQLAHEKLNQAEKLNPLRPQTHHIRGLIYELDQTEKAKIEFEKALKLDPRFLYSRIHLATLLHKEGQLKTANKILYDGANYTYPKNKVMLKYMRLLVKYSKEAGIKGFSSLIEENIKQYFDENTEKQ